MKIHISCLQCDVEIQEGAAARKTVYQTQVSNGLVYDLTCDYGHRSLIFLQNSKFEIIFQAGISALNDGYYREAVFSFAVALERFYEYSVLYFLYDKIVSKPWLHMDEEAKKTYQSLWSSMSKQSERQVGAFYSLYFSEYQKVAPVFSSPWMKENLSFDIKIDGKKVDPIYFRNIVVHQGYMPSKEQAVLYGEAVNKYIYPFIKKYYEADERKMSTIMQNERLMDFQKLKDEGKVDDDLMQVGTGIDSFIAVLQPNYIKKEKSLLNLFPL